MDAHHPSSFRLKTSKELQDNPRKPILMEGWPRFVCYGDSNRNYLSIIWDCIRDKTFIAQLFTDNAYVYFQVLKCSKREKTDTHKGQFSI